MVSNDLITAVAVAGEMTGARWTVATKEAFIRMLASYPEDEVIRALEKCCLELTRPVTLAEVVARIDDGRPGVEEAYALLPKSEDASVVWTEEMAEAYAVSRQIPDQIGARMAFKEKYVAMVSEARRKRKPARWTPSLGLDKSDHARVLKEAVDRGRLTATQAAALLPDGIASPKGLLMIGTDIQPEEAAENVAERARELARLILKDAPVERQAREAIRQKASPTEHEAKVREQLKELKEQS